MGISVHYMYIYICVYIYMLEVGEGKWESLGVPAELKTEDHLNVRV